MLAKKLSTKQQFKCDNHNNITLHWSNLEWLKYKTAKPLLYTVYRTRNRKQLDGTDPEKR